MRIRKRKPKHRKRVIRRPHDQAEAEKREEWYRKGWADMQGAVIAAKDTFDRIEIPNAQGNFPAKAFCHCCKRMF